MNIIIFLLNYLLSFFMNIKIEISLKTVFRQTSGLNVLKQREERREESRIHLAHLLNMHSFFSFTNFIFQKKSFMALRK